MKKQVIVERTIDHTSRTYHEFHAQLQVHQEGIEQRAEEDLAREQEMKTRNTYELNSDDVDWETKGLVCSSRISINSINYS